MQLVSRGHSFREVAAILKLDPMQVFRDYRRVLRELNKQRLLTHKDELVTQAIEELRAIKHDSWREWRRSRKDAKRVVTRSQPVAVCPVCAGDGHITKVKRTHNRSSGEWEEREETQPCRRCGCKGQVGGVIEVTETVEGRLGDPRYLQLAGNALKEELAYQGVTTDGHPTEGGGMGGQEQLPWEEGLRKAVEEANGPDPLEEAIAAVAQQAPARLPCRLSELRESSTGDPTEGPPAERGPQPWSG